MLGQAMVAEARGRGMDVSGAGRSGPDVVVDVREEATLDDALGRTRPDVVVNSAAIVDLSLCEAQPDLAYAVNARSVALLVGICRRGSARLVHISTDHYYVGDGDAPHNELASVHLVNEYARTKFAGEAFALTLPGSLVVRTNVTGFRGRPETPTFIEWAVAAISAGDPLTLFDDFYTSTMAAYDCAATVFELLEADVAGLINVASSTVSSKLEFVTALAEEMGHPLNEPLVRTVRGLRPRRAESLGLDVSRAESILGRPMPNLRATVGALVAARPLPA